MDETRPIWAGLGNCFRSGLVGLCRALVRTPPTRHDLPPICVLCWCRCVLPWCSTRRSCTDWAVNPSYVDAQCDDAAWMMAYDVKH